MTYDCTPSVSCEPPHPWLDAVDELRRRTAGRVLLPGEPGYDDVRGPGGWRDDRPAVVTEPANACDVATAVRFARRTGVRVAVLATGHGVGRPADGALLVNTSRLSQVSVDATEGVAHVGAGATWQQVVDASAPHGLAPVSATSGQVGAVGSTLGGGMGWLARRHGLACDHVRSFDLVVPDGRELHVGPDGDRELWWALRGAGPGTLGVATGMAVALVPVAFVHAGMLVHPIDRAAEVLTRWGTQAPSMPDGLTSSVTIVHPGHGERPVVVVRACWCGDDPADGAALVEEWRRWSPALLDTFDTMPYAEVGSLGADEPPAGSLRSTSECIDVWDAALVERLVHAAVAARPSIRAATAVEVRHAGGAVRRLGRRSVDGAARSAEFVLRLTGVTSSAADDVLLETWQRRSRTALRPWVTGRAHVNFLDGSERAERAASAFGATELSRLRATTTNVDPEGRFCHGLGLGSL